MTRLSINHLDLRHVHLNRIQRFTPRLLLTERKIEKSLHRQVHIHITRVHLHSVALLLCLPKRNQSSSSCTAANADDF